ncbi:MAG: hypothetical protein ACLQKA_10200 [Bryobacteraceae bacterium]
MQPLTRMAIYREGEPPLSQHFQRRWLLKAFALLGALPLAASAATGTQVEQRIRADVAAGRPVVAHVIVALCDNLNQGIVPVPKSIGNGQDARSNLYWGAGYGVRSYFSRQAGYSLRQLSFSGQVLDRIMLTKELRGVGHPVHLVVIAEAWDGSAIAPAIGRFLSLAAGHDPESIAPAAAGGAAIAAGGDAAIVAYVGHNGLMDFAAPSRPLARPGAPPRSSIVLACASSQYFYDLIHAGGSHPLLLTTGLMAPEAYSLEEAVRTFAGGGSPMEVRQAAATIYDRVQHCGRLGALHLFASAP